MKAPYTFEFTTGIGDNIPPSITLIRPKNNENVSALVEINATASDNIAVAKVAFYVETTEIINFTKIPYMIPWDSTKVSDGQHNISATAWDTSGNINTTKVKVNVMNQDYIPPTVKIFTPSNNSAVSKDVTIEVDAKDNKAVRYVAILIDGSEIANLTKAPYRHVWNSSNVSDGPHEIKAIASDLMGNKASDKIKVTTANHDVTPPTVSFTKPTAGEKLSGTAAIEISASDNLGISKVELRIDTAVAKTFTSVPYSYNWSTTSAANGNHTLNATAYDGANNKGYTEITVQVKNGNTPPVITHKGVDSVVEGSDITIVATIKDDEGVKMASINITYGAGDIATVPMKPTSTANEYSGIIPGNLVKPLLIGYYIYAEDSTGMSTKTSTYWVNVKRGGGISGDILLIALVVIAVVVVLIIVILLIRGRKKKEQAQGMPSSPFGGGSSEGERITGTIPDFGDSRSEEGMGQEQRGPPQGFAPQQSYQQQGYPQQGYQQPMGGYAPMAPPQYQQPAPMMQQPQAPPPKAGGEDDWGFPSGGQATPVQGKTTTECPSCGGTNPVGSKWCTNCGGKLT